ncbi:MAG: PAC2 family protein [Chloroflexi bacterium]|nr:PAC2 family protein [Chloroflexota bacterium]
MEFLTVERRPDLHDPMAIVAFSGWNDAASAATDAARFVIRRLGARRFATIDADPFYDFRESRPAVSISFGGEREVKWPKNEFFYARNPAGPHDIVVFVGVEPSLGWSAFTRAHVDLYRDLGTGLVVSLGALLADVPHTREPRVTGTAIDPEVAARLELTTSRYEGPTGIVGVLHDRLRRAGTPAASLWANVPHYITTSQNPNATAALLRRLGVLTGLTFDLRDLQSAGERFVAEVNTALEGNDEIAQYVRRLEEAADDPSRQDTERTGGFVPPGEDLLLDIEEFLRQNRGDT